MNIIDHVISLELAKKLKEVGYPQDDSFWYWDLQFTNNFDPGEPTPAREEYIICRKGERHHPEWSYAAPLATELGKQLPIYVYTYKTPSLRFLAEEHIGWRHIGKPEFTLDSDTEANARAKMWLYLKKNDLLKNS